MSINATAFNGTARHPVRRIRVQLSIPLVADRFQDYRLRLYSTMRVRMLLLKNWNAFDDALLHGFS